MNREKLLEAISKSLEDKGKKKFTQSVELIVNVRGIDFSKSENRLNIDIPLPKGKGGKEQKIAVIAEEALSAECKNAGADLFILPTEIGNWSAPEKIKDLAKNYLLLAQPNLMGQVAKALGQYLGPRGKLPKPLIGNVATLIERTRRSVRITSKGRYLPVVHSFVGTEAMSVEDLAENVEAVYDAIKAKVSEGNIKSVYIKLTMGRPVRVV